MRYEYKQAEQDPMGCLVFLFVLAFMAGTIVWILLHAGGKI